MKSRPPKFRTLAGVLMLSVLAPPALAELEGAGPVSPDNGYPIFYEDTNGLKLALCLSFAVDDPAQPLCLVDPPVELTDPELPFPDNYGGTFPDEAFWWAGEAEVETAGGGTGQLGLALEAAFLNEEVVDGDQIAFGRIRYRIDNLRAGREYTITTPFGVFTETAEAPLGDRMINVTHDVGRVAGEFRIVLDSPIGPFLTWDSDLPIFDDNGVEYIGDPNVPHTVTGSELMVAHGYGMAGPGPANFFRIEGPGVARSLDGVNPNSNLDRCEDAALGPNPNNRNDCVETELFAIQGQIASSFGVNPVRTTYTRFGNGNGRIDVLASTVPGQQIVVGYSDREWTLVEDGTTGRYFARVPFNGNVPFPADGAVRLTNLSDMPNTTVQSPLSDVLTISRASYDTDGSSLRLRVQSSDSALAGGFEAVDDFGRAICPGILGNDVAVDCPGFVSGEVSVTSPKGGTARRSVDISGSTVFE